MQADDLRGAEGGVILFDDVVVGGDLLAAGEVFVALDEGGGMVVFVEAGHPVGGGGGTEGGFDERFELRAVRPAAPAAGEARIVFEVVEVEGFDETRNEFLIRTLYRANAELGGQKSLEPGSFPPGRAQLFPGEGSGISGIGRLA